MLNVVNIPEFAFYSLYILYHAMAWELQVLLEFSWLSVLCPCLCCSVWFFPWKLHFVIAIRHFRAVIVLSQVNGHLSFHFLNFKHSSKCIFFSPGSALCCLNWKSVLINDVNLYSMEVTKGFILNVFWNTLFLLHLLSM